MEANIKRLVKMFILIISRWKDPRITEIKYSFKVAPLRLLECDKSLLLKP